MKPPVCRSVAFQNLFFFTVFSQGYQAFASYTRDLVVAPGHEKVLGYCSICQSTDYIFMNADALDQKGWDAVVTKMIKVYGAPVPDSDREMLIQYLTVHYSKTSRTVQK